MATRNKRNSLIEARVLEGFLKKKSPNRFGGWQTRYFKVERDGKVLSYYKSKPKADERSLGEIDIAQIINVETYAKADEPKRFQIVYPDRKFKMQANSVEEATLWRACLERLCLAVHNISLDDVPDVTVGSAPNMFGVKKAWKTKVREDVEKKLVSPSSDGPLPLLPASPSASASRPVSTSFKESETEPISPKKLPLQQQAHAYDMQPIAAVSRDSPRSDQDGYPDETTPMRPSKQQSSPRTNPLPASRVPIPAAEVNRLSNALRPSFDSTSELRAMPAASSPVAAGSLAGSPSPDRRMRRMEDEPMPTRAAMPTSEMTRITNSMQAQPSFKAGSPVQVESSSPSRVPIPSQEISRLSSSLKSQPSSLKSQASSLPRSLIPSQEGPLRKKICQQLMKAGEYNWYYYAIMGSVRKQSAHRFKYYQARWCFLYSSRPLFANADSVPDFHENLDMPFHMEPDTLYYFKDVNNFAPPQGAIPLKNIVAVKANERDKEGCIIRLDVGARVYKFICDSKSDMDRWKCALEKSQKAANEKLASITGRPRSLTRIIDQFDSGAVNELRDSINESFSQTFDGVPDDATVEQILDATDLAMDELTGILDSSLACKPPRLDIAGFYMRNYHQRVCDELQNMWNRLGRDMVPKDILLLVEWVYDYHSQLGKFGVFDARLTNGVTSLSNVYARRVLNTMLGMTINILANERDLPVEIDDAGCASTTAAVDLFQMLMEQVSFVKSRSIEVLTVKVLEACKEVISQYQITVEDLLNADSIPLEVDFLMALTNNATVMAEHTTALFDIKKRLDPDSLPVSRSISSSSLYSSPIHEEELQGDVLIDCKDTNSNFEYLGSLTIKRLMDLVFVDLDHFFNDSYIKIDTDAVLNDISDFINENFSMLSEPNRRKFLLECLKELMFLYIQCLFNGKKTFKSGGTIDQTVEKLGHDVAAMSNFFEEFIPADQLKEHLQTIQYIYDFLESGPGLITFSCASLKRYFGADLVPQVIDAMLSMRTDFDKTEKREAAASCQSTLTQIVAKPTDGLALQLYPEGFFSRIFTQTSLLSMSSQSAKPVSNLTGSPPKSSQQHVELSQQPKRGHRASVLQLRSDRTQTISLECFLGTDAHEMSTPDTIMEEDEEAEEEDEDEEDGDAGHHYRRTSAHTRVRSHTVARRSSAKMGDVPILEGYLMKKSPNKLKGYQKRYFAVKKSTLYWFKTHKALSAQGHFSLRRVDSIKVADSDDVTFVLTVAQRVFRLQAMDGGDRERWLRGLQQQISDSRKNTEAESERRCVSLKVFENPTGETLFPDFDTNGASKDVGSLNSMKAAARVVATQEDRQTRPLSIKSDASSRTRQRPVIENDGCPGCCFPILAILGLRSSPAPAAGSSASDHGRAAYSNFT